jgi:asparagine synthetase B (glutamine-hydrolysing)
MCGICGIAVQEQPFDQKRPINRVMSMLESLAHRGPNALGMSMSSQAAGGASRLVAGVDFGINVEPAVKRLEEHRRREADHARTLWSLTVLFEWLAWDKARICGVF